MRKIAILALLLVPILALSSIAAPPAGGNNEMFSVHKGALVDNTQYIDANNILMFVTNHGNFCRDLSDVFGYDAGTFFPYNTTADIESGLLDNYCLYASGLWIGGKNQANDSIQVIIAEYSDEYVPGPMSGGTFIEDNSTFKVYKLYSDSMWSNPNDDWTNFPHGQGGNPDHGAPWRYHYTAYDEDGLPTDSVIGPDMIGDQFLWAVYNDADPDQHTNNQGETEPMGIEVRQSTFAFDRTDALGNVIFVRFRVYNKGANSFDSLFMSLWSDPDLGGPASDFVGCDPELGLGFVYNSDNNDRDYGSKPPSVGYDFFQGPLRAVTVDDDPVGYEYTYDVDSTITDSTAYYGKAWGVNWTDSANIGMISFNKYINGTDPDDYGETWNYMRGFNRDGTEYTDTSTGLVTKFFNSGDPVAGTGDLDVAPADRRFMQTTGPITFLPGDSVEIVAAIVVGDGADRLSSVSVMRYYDRFAQLAYNQDFDVPAPPVAPVVDVNELPEQISLIWTDTSEVDQGDYIFEGYTVYQGTSPTGPWTRLANFDVDNGTGVIFDEVIDPNTSALEIRAVKFGSDGGVERHIIFDNDAINGGPLRDLTTYYYKVEAYSYLESGLPKTLTSQTIISAEPQAPVAGTEWAYEAGDTLMVTHTGNSDGSVTAIVVDPAALTGHSYGVVFETDATLGPVWHLIDFTDGDTVLTDQTNQDGDNQYLVTEGFQVITRGAAAGVLTDDQYSTDDSSIWGWDIPEGTRRFTWAGGADGYGFEGFQGTIGYDSPYTFFGIGTDMAVTPAETKDILLVLATADTNGVFDTVNDTNVSYGYRFGRGFSGAAARPEFAAHIINAVGGYSYQDFEKSIPLAAYDVESDPPQRLALGYLENNTYWGLVDGMWWPPYYGADTTSGDYDYFGNNTNGAGPREWLFILNSPYTETPVAALQTDILTDGTLPVMYFCTFARRGQVDWSPDSTGEDQFYIRDSEVNAAVDTFSFVATAPTIETAGADNLDAINVVPNPFYLYGPYDPAAGNYKIRFQHLPEQCTISIYNLAGDLVYSWEKTVSGPYDDWNATTFNGLPVASGIYIYVVDAPGFGQKVGKMAVFTEEEVLQIY